MEPAPRQPRPWILPVLVFAQFAGTSLWFAGNSVLPDLLRRPGLQGASLGGVVSAVQLGFIAGTLVFALLTLADRVPPARLFLLSALLGSLTNLGLLWPELSAAGLLGLRFATGLCLAGIYPVGMKIAADYYAGGLGKALGFLVGALVLGTALPHGLRWLGTGLPWAAVVLATSGLAAGGGILLWLLVPNGPFRRPGSRLEPGAVRGIWQHPPFRAAALGYFGHMWELYTFWAFVPLLLTVYRQLHPGPAELPAGLAFGVIASGALACVGSGYLAQRWGSLRPARLALWVSGACCVLSPVLLQLPPFLFIAAVLVWGLAVVADSPQFSALVAQQAPTAIKGTALTLVTCLGFALTIVSLQLFGALQSVVAGQYLFLLLAPGPVLGLWATRKTAASA
ncbi:MFS transporter [Hymenobacter chitinivorans]|uniref:Putative MFS family arabinose efflux permease n=1 Tax=Hymenobacter chitinivorans DSM 11115 TaxID=1121954 RepID=A0A2M9BNM5_9BACT|nr:MFS transporter [Hymenobacter chitinivorans]PJJ59542.1 putative MFS family arabinose efflux permease [Hymenobacter chitinivorans DSM 11115]